MALKGLGSPAETTDYLIDLWTSDNGLPDSSVTSIAQTPDGYLWIGTYNGLTRFDGVQFVNFDPFNTPALKHARIDGLFVDPQGTLWINTRDGSMTALRHGVFTHEWQGGQVASVFWRDNKIYFALLYGQLVCRNETSNPPGPWQSIPLAATATGNFFRQDNTGTLWYLTRDNVLEKIIGTNSEQLSSQDFLNGERANCLAADVAGRIWVGTEKRLLRWRGNHFEDQTPTNGPVNVSFIACAGGNACWVIANGQTRKCVDRHWVANGTGWEDLSEAPTAFLNAYQDRAQGVWIRHYGKGLFHAKADGTTQRISSANGLPGDRVSAWFQDREGNIWVGIDRGGLIRLREKRFDVIGAAEGLAIPAVSSVCEDRDGSIWIGTFGGGLNRWRDGVLKQFNIPDGNYRGNFFSAYPDPQGKIWLSAGREDLFVLENETFSQPPELVHGIKAILVDHQGRVWMGRQNGLTLLEKGRATSFSSTNGFDRRDIRALAEDPRGNIWVGTGGGTLYHFDGRQFISHPLTGSPTNQAIWSLLPDTDGTLWIGTFRGGLLRFKDGKFTRYTTRDGLPGDIICQLLEDDAGKLWIGSHKGIFYIPKSSFKDFDDGKIPALPCISYGLYDGLPTLECSGNYQPTCWRGHDGKLWFATVKGLVSIFPAELSRNQLPPPVVIENVLVDEKVAEVGSQKSEDGLPTSDFRLPASALRPLTIAPGKHQFDFHYTALSFAAPDKVRFRYQLQGLDESWVEAGGKRSAHYGPLRPGRYRFRVIACNNDGVWNEEGAALAFTVLPEFWQTWWFNTLLGIFLVGIIFSTARFVATRKLRKKLDQLRQQRAIERERERIARDIHDDLGAGLTQIMLQSALARRAGHDQTPAHLVQISETAHELVGAMDEIVWAIDPENDTLDGLVTYVGKFFQEYVTMAGLRCRLDLPAQPPSLMVSAEVRHNLFLAIKETLNNVVKHSAATEVSLQLKTAAASFSFTLQDNGRGFAPDDNKSAAAQNRNSSGHGLHNLTDRLKKIGGICTIKSEPEKGTEVTLTVML